MIENTKKPYLSIAATCQHVLEEKDGVISGIRFVDRLTITHRDESATGQMPVIPIPLGIIVSFKTGPARGKRILELRVYNPHGQLKAEPLKQEIFFGDDEFTGLNVIVRLSLTPEEPGVHWIDVLLSDEVITRMPMHILYVEEQN